MLDVRPASSTQTIPSQLPWTKETTAAAKAIVIRRGGEVMGFAVQRMICQQEVVIRPLEDPLVRVGHQDITRVQVWMELDHLGEIVGAQGAAKSGWWSGTPAGLAPGSDCQSWRACLA